MVNNCVVCKSELEEDTIIVGNQFPSAIFANKGEDYTQSIDSSSLNLTRCSNNSCSLVQLSTDYDLDIVRTEHRYLGKENITNLQYKEFFGGIDSLLAFEKTLKDDLP